MTYYGSEQRGHLYLPGWVPHTPHSLGSGFFRGGDAGSAAAVLKLGSAAEGSAGGGAVGSGESEPRAVDEATAVSLEGMSPLSGSPVCPRLMAGTRLARGSDCGGLGGFNKAGSGVPFVLGLGVRVLVGMTRAGN